MVSVARQKSADYEWLFVLRMAKLTACVVAVAKAVFEHIWVGGRELLRGLPRVVQDAYVPFCTFLRFPTEEEVEIELAKLGYLALDHRRKNNA